MAIWPPIIQSGGRIGNCRDWGRCSAVGRIKITHLKFRLFCEHATRQTRAHFEIASFRIIFGSPSINNAHKFGLSFCIWLLSRKELRKIKDIPRFDIICYTWLYLFVVSRLSSFKSILKGEENAPLILHVYGTR